MDLSRLSTLSLNNSNDIIANNISLINANKTINLLDLFVLKNEYEFTEQIFVDSFYNKHRHIRDWKLLIFLIVVITI